MCVCFSISTYFACFTRIHDFLFVHLVHLVYFNPIYKSRSAQCLWEPHLPSTEMKQTLMLFWQEYIGGGNCSKLVFDAACQSLNHFETCFEQRTLAGSFTSAYFARTTRPYLFRKMFQLPAQLRRITDITVCRKQPSTDGFWDILRSSMTSQQQICILSSLPRSLFHWAAARCQIEWLHQ